MLSTIILYPRSYNKRGESSKHSVVGVTRDGKVINVKLRLSEAAASHQNPPSIAEFSRNDRKAKLACQADENNGPDNPFGILLFAYCTLEESDTGIETWVAKWAHVLAVDSESPAPLLGVGRISINTRTNGVISAERNIERLVREGMENTEEYEKFSKQLLDRSQYHYSAVLYQYEKKEEFEFFEKEIFLSVAESFIDDNTHSGITGGFYIAAYNKDGLLFSQEIFSKYVLGIQRYQTGLEAAKSFLDSNLQVLRNALRFSILPLQRINSGPRGNSHFGQPNKYQQICNLFSSHVEDYRVRKIAVRVSFFEDTQNTLLSRYYSLDDESMAPYEYQEQKLKCSLAKRIVDQRLIPVSFFFDQPIPVFPHFPNVILPVIEDVVPVEVSEVQPDSLAKDPGGVASLREDFACIVHENEFVTQEEECDIKIDDFDSAPLADQNFVDASGSELEKHPEIDVAHIEAQDESDIAQSEIFSDFSNFIVDQLAPSQEDFSNKPMEPVQDELITDSLEIADGGDVADEEGSRKAIVDELDSNTVSLTAPEIVEAGIVEDSASDDLGVAQDHIKEEIAVSMSTDINVPEEKKLTGMAAFFSRKK